MLHCSHCLIHCEADRLDDFVCCPGCGKVLGQFSGGKYIDHRKPILEKAAKLKKIKKKQLQHDQKPILAKLDTADPQLAT